MTAVFMLVMLIGNQQVFGSLVEPNLSGAKIGISPLVLLLTVMLFSQVWGIAGAIIGAPMIIMIRLILDENERTRPVAVMMANDVEEVIKSAFSSMFGLFWSQKELIREALSPTHANEPSGLLFAVKYLADAQRMRFADEGFLCGTTVRVPSTRCSVVSTTLSA
ncbi:MAG: hypothetical protein CM15mP78_07060 [Candidatus Poseidoniales archaeon]|nr:MAG: hypothetical protein CM15mP78_07060 [Candidatus Poseidoniales archaeon]